VCVDVRSLPVDGICIPKIGEINSEQIDCKPMTGESIPGVDCIGKVAELGSTEVYGKWPQPTPTFGSTTSGSEYCVSGMVSNA